MAKRRRAIGITFDEDSPAPLYRQIYEQIRQAIIAGTLAEGDRLPSIRGLADELNVSHTTIEQAYLQLSVEGYATGKARSGFIVEQVDTHYLLQPKRGKREIIEQGERTRSRDTFSDEMLQGAKARYDFSYANLQPGSFPTKIWRRLTNDVLYANELPAFSRYESPHEPDRLARILSGYLGRTRGVDCLPEQVIIQAGTDGALTSLLQLFNRGTVFGMEEPGYAAARETAERLGYAITPLPSDQGSAAFLRALDVSKPALVFVTPSHQFPTGAVLDLNARIELLKWARTNDAYLIEDDSCNEYRYDVEPIPSLQSLDADERVIYLGNVSKVLSPALRIAYVVLPPKLLVRHRRLFAHTHPAVSLLEREVLARFIDEGYGEQHTRRMALGNRKRHDALLENLEHELGDIIDIQGRHAGMHLFVTVHNGMTQEELLATALREGAAVYGTKRMWFSQPAPEDKVMVGFSALDIADIPAGVAALKRAWKQ